MNQLTTNHARPPMIILLILVIHMVCFFGTVEVVADGNMSAILPTAAELPGFVNIVTNRRIPNGGTYQLAMRKSDKFAVRTSIYQDVSEAAAQQRVRSAVYGAQSSKSKKGSPSGRVIGQETFHTPDVKTPTNGFTLATRTGVVVIVIQAMVPAQGRRDGNGKMIHKLIPLADLKLLEDLAINRVNKLVKMRSTQ